MRTAAKRFWTRSKGNFNPDLDKAHSYHDLYLFLCHISGRELFERGRYVNAGTVILAV
jgi:hypothetical protein